MVLSREHYDVRRINHRVLECQGVLTVDISDNILCFPSFFHRDDNTDLKLLNTVSFLYNALWTKLSYCYYASLRSTFLRVLPTFHREEGMNP